MSKRLVAPLIVLVAVAILGGVWLYVSRVPPAPPQSDLASPTDTPGPLREFYPNGIAYRGGVFTWEHIFEQRGGQDLEYYRGTAPDRSITLILRDLPEPEFSRVTQFTEHLVTIPLGKAVLNVRADVEARDETEELLAPLYTFVGERPLAPGEEMPDFGLGRDGPGKP